LVAQSQVLQLERSARMEDRRQICEECRERNNPHPLKHFEIFEKQNRFGWYLEPSYDFKFGPGMSIRSA